MAALPKVSDPMASSGCRKNFLYQEFKLFCQEIRPPLVALLLIITLIFYTGLVQSWLWLFLVLCLFVVSLVDLTPSVLRSLWPWFIFLVLLLYGAGQGLSGMNAVMNGDGYGSYYPWATFRAVSYGGCFLLLGISFCLVVRSKKFWDTFLPGLAIAMFILLFLALVQKASGRQIILWRCKFPTWTLFGPFSIKNHFSALIVQTMPMLLAYLHWRWLSWEKDLSSLKCSFKEQSVSFFKSCLPFLLLLIGFMFFMVFYAMGKLALIVLSAAFLVYLCLIVRFEKKIVWALLLVLAVVVGVLLPVLSEHLWADKFNKLLVDSTFSRLVALTGTMDFWRQHTFFGTGLGSYYYISTHFIPLDFGIWKYAHNDYAEALLETGLVGVGLLVFMIGVFLHRGILNLRRHTSLFWKILTLQALVSIGLFALLEVSDFHAKIPINAMVLLLQISILFVPPQHEDAGVVQEDPVGGKPWRWVFLVAALGGVLFLGIFTFRERRYETFYYAQSVEVLEEGVKEFPESAPLWRFLSKAYEAKAKALKLKGEDRLAVYQQAIGSIEKAATLAPSFPFYWQELSSLQMETGQYGPARESLRKAQYWAPHSGRTRGLIKKLKALPSL